MIDKGRFLFKANRYKDYFVSFEYMGKHMLGILGYASELEVCIVHKGMHVAKSTEEIKPMAEKILNVLKPAFRFGENEIFTTGSLGISLYPQDGEDVETLLKSADTAMYRAKRRGRNTFQMFDVGMKAEMFQQLSLGNGLRRAIERREFVVHYQPQISLQTGEIIGMEALVRWQHPEYGLIPPTSFIHWAEDSGLIIPIGELVLQMACEQNKEWLKAGHRPIRVGVNLSARQFRDSNVIDLVSKTLADTGLPAECLELELTETVAMEMGGAAVNIPHELKAMGVGFSIDDFGTGYSSLNYLKRLPVNTLKMDQSFVKDITTNSNDAAIATAVIALGHGLNLAVLAEGVETEGQLEHLKQLKCDRIQGFLFSKPLPANEFELLLKEKRRFEESNLFKIQE
jgi:EAL domain-containing protein (putative c-di-GMP-specific phosphodiesterase class I)